MAKNIFILDNKLPLVVTTGLMASLPVLAAVANQNQDSNQWQCVATQSGEWHCDGTATTSNKRLVATTAKPIQVASIDFKRPVPTNDSDPVQCPTDSSAQTATTLDWRPLDQLSPAQQAQRKNQLCGGGYAEPARPGQNFTGNINDAPIYLEGDSSSYNAEGVGMLYGNAVIRQGYRQVESSTAQLDRRNDTATFTDNVVLREPNLLMTGSSGTVNTQTGQAEIHNAQYVLHQEGVRGKAQSIVRQSDGQIDLTRATYTTCPPGSCVWQLSGRTVNLNPESGFGTATHATVDIFGLPIFYTPWMSFPINDKRKSGLLFPTFALDTSSDGDGFDYTQPIYWNIAPNMDATITPRVLTNRLAIVENEFRHMSASSNTVVAGAYTTPDQTREKNLNYDQNRWFVHMNHQQQLTDNWDYTINYTRASDREYFSDFGTGIDISALDPLSQSFYTTYSSSGNGPFQWGLSLGTQHWQNMSQSADNPYNKNVDLLFNGGWDQGTGFGFNYTVAYTDFQRDEDWQYKRTAVLDDRYDVTEGIFGPGAANNINNANGGRLYAETGVKYRFENTYAFFEPGVKVRSVHYRLNDLQQAYVDQYAGGSYDRAETPSTSAPTAYVDGGLIFERPTSFGNMNFTQTLEPRMRYVYTPYRADQGLNPAFSTGESMFSYNSLWQDDRFNGYDRIGDTNHLSLGLTTRFLESDGYERFRFSVGQMIFFEDRQVMIDPLLGEVIVDNKNESDTNLNEENQRLLAANTATRSPIASQLVWNIRKDLRLTQDWVYNTDQRWNQDYALSLQYQPKPGAVFNASYRYRNQVERALKDRNGNNVIGTSGPIYVNGDLEEASVSAVWPISTQWSILGRYTRDITNHRHMDRAIGFEQDACCYKIRVMYRNWIDPLEDIDTASADKGIFLEFVLKGLGNLSSSRVTEFLKDISGYNSR